MNKKGFTLLEVLISIMILAGSMIILSMAWSGNLLKFRSARANNHIAFLLEQKATEFELRFNGKTKDQIDDELSGNFGSDYPNYRWAFESQEFVFPNLGALLKSQDQDNSNELIQTVAKKMKEYFEDSVTEAKITIFRKERDKERKQSISLYFVNYDQAVTLPTSGGGP